MSNVRTFINADGKQFPPRRPYGVCINPSGDVSMIRDDNDDLRIANKSEHFLRIKKMMQGFGQATPETPTMPDEDTRNLRCRLIFEEAIEYANACGFSVIPETSDELIDADSLVFVRNRIPDLVEMVDANCDLSVVNIGSLVASGVSDVDVLKAVDENNLLKVATGTRDEHGKFIKAKDHPKVQLAPIIERMK